jgi:hypothetical protein
MRYSFRTSSLVYSLFIHEIAMLGMSEYKNEGQRAVNGTEENQAHSKT